MARKRAEHWKPPQSAQKPSSLLPTGYDDLLGQTMERLRSAQLRASLAVNREMIVLYWQIGCDILTRQEREGWGTKVIDRPPPIFVMHILT
jgi:predicted nuclease of restriction endonuclease-like (RecB) superfamily